MPLDRVNVSPVRLNNGVQIHHDLVSDLDRLISGPPAIRDGAINQQQMVVGADLSFIQDDYTSAIADLEGRVEAWERGVTRDYTVAAIVTTPTAIAGATIPTYAAPAPIYADWILVNGGDLAANGIYSIATGAKIPDFDFPVGTEVFVDAVNEVYRVNTEPTRDDASGAVTGVTLEPWIRFTGYTDAGAVQVQGTVISLASNTARLTQTGDILDFSPETEAELQGLHDTDAALSAENARQQGTLDTHTRDITAIQQLNQQQQALLDTHTTDIANIQRLDQQQQALLDTHTTDIAAIQQTDRSQQLQINGHTEDISQIRQVDARQSDQIAGLQGTVDQHSGQLSALATRATQAESRLDADEQAIAQIQQLDRTQSGQIDDLYVQLATKDTPENRDAAITTNIQRFVADYFPEIALITGDSRIQATYNVAANETVITLTGMKQGSQIAGIYDPQGYGAQITKPRRLNAGTVLNFAVKGNVTLAGDAATAWKVCVTTHIPLNFTADPNTPALSQPTL